jgi:hypothetical protein
MKKMLIVLVLLTVLPSARVAAQQHADARHEKSATTAAASAELEKKILGLEARRIAAMVKKDLATLDALLADDLSYTHSGGNTDTKASFMTLIKERGRYLGVDYSNTQVIPWGGNSVLVRGRAEIRLENTPGYGVLFVDVWALRDGAWKMVAWQATRIP